MSVVALVIAPSIALNADQMSAYNNKTITVELHENVNSNTPKEVQKEVRVEVNDNGEKTATVITTTIKNGEKILVKKTLTGAEVDELLKESKE
jgi:K(+)-stimulated pyrophosphate-energized sodium pump